jgi:hypothetical protein
MDQSLKYNSDSSNCALTAERQDGSEESIGCEGEGVDMSRGTWKFRKMSVKVAVACPPESDTLYSCGWHGTHSRWSVHCISKVQ